VLLALAGMLLLSGEAADATDVWPGVGMGQVKPEGVNATLCFEGELRVEFGRHFALQPNLGYWKRSEKVSNISVTARDFSFGFTALGLLPVPPVRFFGGAGPFVHDISGDVASFGYSVSSDSLTRIGFTALGGIDVHISRSFVFFFTARYDWVPLGDVVPDSMNQRRIYGGFRLGL
jgi:hypothetical protein